MIEALLLLLVTDASSPLPPERCARRVDFLHRALGHPNTEGYIELTEVQRRVALDYLRENGHELEDRLPHSHILLLVGRNGMGRLVFGDDVRVCETYILPPSYMGELMDLIRGEEI